MQYSVAMQYEFRKDIEESTDPHFKRAMQAELDALMTGKPSLTAAIWAGGSNLVGAAGGGPPGQASTPVTDDEL